MNASLPDSLVDARLLAPRDRHPRIMETWHALPEGGAMVVVSDHDPVPLYYQFVCEYMGTFHWEYLDRGPEVWRVRLTRGTFADPGFTPSARMATPKPLSAPTAEPLLLDVRPIFARGETPCAAIDVAMAQTQAGQTLVLLVPFEPVPLYSKFARAGFRHESRVEEDGTWRIEFCRERAVTTPTATCGCGHD
jgi:uncharacterized protein (DUF2249 family)